MDRATQNGRITKGIPAKTLAIKTLKFVEDNLAVWRDDPDRPNVDSERELNSQLCKFLNIEARRSEFSMAHFHHEESQGGHRAVDISANPIGGEYIEGSQYTKYDPFLVMEGKRLPTPGSDREREYTSSAEGSPPGGGIQRFKLGLHGQRLPIASMIGYVQDGDCPTWFDQVNQWVGDLATSANPLWTSNDRLDQLSYDQDSRVSRCESEHVRDLGVSPTIRLTHLWVEM